MSSAPTTVLREGAQCRGRWLHTARPNRGHPLIARTVTRSQSQATTQRSRHRGRHTEASPINTARCGPLALCQHIAPKLLLRDLERPPSAHRRCPGHICRSHRQLQLHTFSRSYWALIPRTALVTSWRDRIRSPGTAVPTAIGATRRRQHVREPSAVADHNQSRGSVRLHSQWNRSATPSSTFSASRSNAEHCIRPIPIRRLSDDSAKRARVGCHL